MRSETYRFRTLCHLTPPSAAEEKKLIQPGLLPFALLLLLPLALLFVGLVVAMDAIEQLENPVPAVAKGQARGLLRGGQRVAGRNVGDGPAAAAPGGSHARQAVASTTGATAHAGGSRAGSRTERIRRGMSRLGVRSGRRARGTFRARAGSAGGGDRKRLRRLSRPGWCYRSRSRHRPSTGSASQSLDLSMPPGLPSSSKTCEQHRSFKRTKHLGKKSSGSRNREDCDAGCGQGHHNLVTTAVARTVVKVIAKVIVLLAVALMGKGDIERSQIFQPR